MINGLLKENTNKMKFKITTLFAFMIFTLSSLSAQDKSPLDGLVAECKPAAGKDSIQSIQSYSLYREFAKQDNYKDARNYWRYVFINAPGLRQTTHIDGVKIYDELLENTEDEAKKKPLLDTLLYIYDVRMKCFGETGDIYGRKALSMLEHDYDDVATFHTFKKAIDMSGNDAAYYVVQYYIYAAIKANRAEAIDDEELLKIYGQIMDIVDFNIDNNVKDKPKFEKVADVVADAMSKTNLLNCDNLRPVLQKQYDNNPDDTKNLEKIYKQLYLAQCATDELFLTVATKLFELEPDAEKARILALNKSNDKEYSEAIKYWKVAVEMVDDAEKKAEYSLTMARMYQNMGDYPSARSSALDAAKYKTGWGEPYLLIGDLYRGSGSRCGKGTGFESQTVTWPAIDMYEKARMVDPSVSSKAASRIKDSEKYMPSKEEGFFQGIKEGESFTVKCWINETTKVRFAPGS